MAEPVVIGLFAVVTLALVVARAARRPQRGSVRRMSNDEMRCVDALLERSRQ